MSSPDDDDWAYRGQPSAPVVHPHALALKHKRSHTAANLHHHGRQNSQSQIQYQPPLPSSLGGHAAPAAAARNPPVIISQPRPSGPPVTTSNQMISQHTRTSSLPDRLRPFIAHEHVTSDAEDPYAPQRNRSTLPSNLRFSSKIVYRPDSVQAAFLDRNWVWHNVGVFLRPNAAGRKRTESGGSSRGRANSGAGDTVIDSVPFLMSDDSNMGMEPGARVGRSEEGVVVMRRTAGSTQLQATSNLTKSVLGAGCFALGAGFKESGLWLGVAGTVVLALLCVYTVRTLVECKRALGEVLSPTAAYEDVVRLAFGGPAARVLEVCVVVTTIGSCAAVVDFVGGLVSEMVAPSAPHDLARFVYIALVFSAVQLPLVLLRNFKFLAVTSVVGNVCFLFAVVALFYDAGRHNNIGRVTDPHQYKQWDLLHFPAFLGKSVYLFVNHFLVFPLEASMAEPSEFYTAVHHSMALSTVVSLGIGFSGYALYGEGVKDLIFNNMAVQEQAVWYQLANWVKVAIIFELAFTFPIIMAAGREIVEKWIIGEDAEDREGANISCITWKRNVTRVVLVVVASGVAIAVPSFSSCVDLISGLGCCVLGFIFPPALYLKICWSQIGWFSKGVQCSICVVGVVVAVVTTYEGVSSLIQ